MIVLFSSFFNLLCIFCILLIIQSNNGLIQCFSIRKHLINSPIQYNHLHHHIKQLNTINKPLVVKQDKLYMINTIISSSDQFSQYAMLTLIASLGMKFEKVSSIGKALSGPVSTMLLASILTNLNILPSNSQYILSLQSIVVKIATPLFLLNANIQKIIKETGVLLKAFSLGTIGTLFGSLISFQLFLPFGLRNLGLDNCWKICSAITSKNIGGGLNFFGVADSLKIPSSVIATGLGVDNIMGLLYFPFVSWIASQYIPKTNDKDIHDMTINEENKNELPINAESMTQSLTISLIIVAISEIISKMTQLPSLPISTLLSIIIASIIPNTVKPLILSGEMIGKFLFYIFFASIGITSGKLFTIFHNPGTFALVGFNFMLYVIHLFFIIGMGKVLHIDLRDILIASNANIGNAATASSFCDTFQWKSKIVPALLIGTLGNSIATFVSLGLSMLLKQFI